MTSSKHSVGIQADWAEAGRRGACAARTLVRGKAMPLHSNESVRFDREIAAATVQDIRMRGIETMELERLLSSQGFGSRATCRQLIRSGRVSVEGQLCDDPLACVEAEGLGFSVDDVKWSYRRFAYLALHKPAGYECSRQPRHHPSVYGLLPRPLLDRGVQAVGRLDQDTTGLLLFTDDGEFIHRCTSPRKHVRKVYEVKSRHPVDDAQIAALLAGVLLHGEEKPISATSCRRIGTHELSLDVTLGKYHLVKRLLAAAGNRVEALHRVAIGGFALPDDLLPGQWMWLEEALRRRVFE